MENECTYEDAQRPTHTARLSDVLREVGGIAHYGTTASQLSTCTHPLYYAVLSQHHRRVALSQHVGASVHRAQPCERLCAAPPHQ